MSNKISALQRVTQIWRCQLGPNIIRVEPERNHKSIHFKTSKLTAVFKPTWRKSRFSNGEPTFVLSNQNSLIFPSDGTSCGCELGRLFATESLREICWPAAGLRGS